MNQTPSFPRSSSVPHLGIRVIAVGALAIGLVLSGCSHANRGSYATDNPVRDTAKADVTYAKAMACMTSDPEEAEGLLRETLGFDLYHGRAHNNLGVLLFASGKLYEAAGEFEWARKLLPGLPEPRVNLALVLDRGGRSQEAIEAAKAALEVQPDDLAAQQAIVLIQVKNGSADATTLDKLQTIIDRAVDPTWVTWAQVERAKLSARLQP